MSVTQKKAPSLGSFGPRVGVFSLAILLCLGCERAERQAAEEGEAHPTSAPPAPVPTAAPPVVDPCLVQVEQLQNEPQVPGTPVFDSHRAEILARARAVPLLFKRVPQADLAGLTDDEVRLTHKYRKVLIKSQDPASDIQVILRRTTRRYALRRAIFLSEGYLFAELPLLALRLSQVLRLDHLFDDPEVVIERGGHEFRAYLEDGRYYLPEEPVVGVVPQRMQHGSPAGLLLFDRARTPEESWKSTPGFALNELAKQLAFETASPIFKTENRWGFELRTRGRRSTIVADVSQTEATLVCESTLQQKRSALLFARNQSLLARELVEPVLSAAREIISRRLPFDEPRTEEGQQDGLLRIAFRKAHRHHRETYEFNGDSYYTYDGFGRPRLPEVCIDFITDSFDWGTGGYWSGRHERARHVRGALYFPSFGIENERSVESLLNYAAAVPSWFDVHFTPKSERVKFLYREKFFAWLAQMHEVYQPGDVVFIYGLRDDEKFHYHSFFIDEKDPVTGVPTLVMANAGPPQARTIEGEMQNAPLRTIVARIRLKPEVLRAAYEQARQRPDQPLVPPPPDYLDEEPEKKGSSLPTAGQ